MKYPAEKKKKYDYTFKFVLVGDTVAGKSSILNRYSYNKFI